MSQCVHVIIRNYVLTLVAWLLAEGRWSLRLILLLSSRKWLIHFLTSFNVKHGFKSSSSHQIICKRIITWESISFKDQIRNKVSKGQMIFVHNWREKLDLKCQLWRIRTIGGSHQLISSDVIDLMGQLIDLIYSLFLKIAARWRQNSFSIAIFLFSKLKLKVTYAHCLKIAQNVAFEFCNFGIFHQFLSY